MATERNIYLSFRSDGDTKGINGDKYVKVCMTMYHKMPTNSI